MGGYKTRGRPRMTENDVIEPNDESRLQQIERESWTSWGMTSLDVRTYQGRQRTNKKKKRKKN